MNLLNQREVWDHTRAVLLDSPEGADIVGPLIQHVLDTSSGLESATRASLQISLIDPPSATRSALTPPTPATDDPTTEPNINAFLFADQLIVSRACRKEIDLVVDSYWTWSAAVAIGGAPSTADEVWSAFVCEHHDHKVSFLLLRPALRGEDWGCEPLPPFRKSLEKLSEFFSTTRRKPPF